METDIPKQTERPVTDKEGGATSLPEQQTTSKQPKEPIVLNSAQQILECVSFLGHKHPRKDIFLYYAGIDVIRVGAFISAFNVHKKQLTQPHQILPLKEGTITIVALAEEFPDEDWIARELREEDYLFHLSNRKPLPTLFKSNINTTASPFQIT